MTALPEARVIELDLFPATCEEALDRLPTAKPTRPMRIIATDTHLVIYAELDGAKSGPKGPDPALVLPLNEFYGRSKDGYVAITDEGDFHITRMKHCGCGSALRSPRPYSGVPYKISNTPLPDGRNLYSG